MALEPAKLSDFQVAGALGSGTTAKVYDAVHSASGRPVAIKILEPSQAGSEMRERFAREALLLAGVDSRHVGKILGFGFSSGQPFLVLERLTGETLDAKLRRDGPVPIPHALRWLEQLMVGVRDCHDAQVIHRDIKPSNIYLHKDGFDEVVKLIDFGVARLREIAGDTGGLTSTNHLIGSMGYMAPEQFTNAKAVGFPADLYAVGVVVFRTLTGRLPFVSRSLEAVIRMKTEQAPPPVSSMPGMPQNPLLDWFVKKSMMRDPASRFQSAREMLEHWWNVMASLDEDTTTDVMRGIGRVDESYMGSPPTVGRERMGAPPETGRDPTPPTVGRESAPRTPSDVVIEDDRTIRVQLRSSPGDPGSERTVREMAPLTQPSPPIAITVEEDAGGGAGDPFDVPTRNDPNLRKLVERELELSRKRKSGA